MGWLNWFLGRTGPWTSPAARQETNRNKPGFWKHETSRKLDNPRLLAAMATALKTRPAIVDRQDAIAKIKANAHLLIGFELTDQSGGAPLETVFAVLGAIAGFACQMSLREQLIVGGKHSERDVFMTIETKSGDVYYAGSALDALLYGRDTNADPAVWKIIADAVRDSGRPVPDITPIIARMADSFGSRSFGEPALPDGVKLYLPSRYLLWKFWNPIRNMHMNESGEIGLLPFAMAGLAADMLRKFKDSCDVGLEAQVFMEAAITMSRISPDRVAYAYFRKSKGNPAKYRSR